MPTIVRRRKCPAPDARPEGHPLYYDLMSFAIGLDVLNHDVGAAIEAIDAGDDDALTDAMQQLSEGEGSAVPFMMQELLAKFADA